MTAAAKPTRVTVTGPSPLPVRNVPPPAPPPGPYPQRAGFARRGDEYPYYRWVTPVPFARVAPLSVRPEGSYPQGPAYVAVPLHRCPTCVPGQGRPVAGPLEASAPYIAIAATGCALVLAYTLYRVAD